MTKPIPNITLHTNGRTWSYNALLYAWQSNDGWDITDQQIAELPAEEGARLLESLRSGGKST